MAHSNFTIAHYTLYHGSHTSLLIHTSVPHTLLTVDAPFSVLAATVSLHRTYTICNVYISPSYRLAADELSRLYQQLPGPVLMLGDFNAHNPLWGSRYLRPRGSLVENFLNDHSLVFLNDGSPTFHSDTWGSCSALDLSLCDPSLAPDYLWTVVDELHGSDHFPIILTHSNSSEPTPSPLPGV